VLKILGDQNKVIQNFIVNSDTVIGQLEARKKDVARWVVEAAKTSETTASRRQAFQAQWHKLPGFLGQLQPTMAKLGNLADQQTPLLADLQRSAPDLNTFFQRLGPFTQGVAPGVQVARPGVAEGQQSPERQPPRGGPAGHALGRRAAARQAAAPVPPDAGQPAAAA